MKISTQEKIKLLELLGASAVIGTVVLKDIAIGDFDTFNSEMNELKSLTNMVLAPYLISYGGTLYFDRITDEYKSLQSMYNQVVNNCVDLMDNFGINNPVEIFAIYVYMYRHGYLSKDKNYSYDIDMKDLGNMAGLDVVRGMGVCRSVASMLTDIYNKKDMKASCLVVDAKNAIPHIEKLCDKDKPDISKKTSIFVKGVELTTKVLPLANHMITGVENDGYSFVFDPMNDGFLVKGNMNKLLLANNKNYHMVYHPIQGTICSLLGQFDSYNPIKVNKQFKLPTIDYEEYKQIYLETLKLCQNNVDIFERFFENNSELYNEISKESENIHGLIGRMTGLGIIKDKIKCKKLNNI